MLENITEYPQGAQVWTGTLRVLHGTLCSTEGGTSILLHDLFIKSLCMCPGPH